MQPASIRIVLTGTTHPGNIGSTARAMKTMGFDRLYLVSPKHLPDQRAFEMAAGAEAIYQGAVITGSLSEALKGTKLVLATSARPRDIDLPGFTPSEAAEFIQSKSDETETAIVFGREHSGLTNEELLQCHFHIQIPANPDYSSLNLAQAVQIIVYELRMKLLSPEALVKTSPKEEEASTEAVEQFYEHLNTVLIQIGFLNLSNPKRLLQRLRRLFNRIHLEKTELNILRGILTHIQKKIPG